MADELIYHYTSARTALEHILRDGKLRMSPITHMRDPLENRVPPPPAMASRSASRDELLRAGGIAADEIGKVWYSARILSMTLDREGGEWHQRGWASARMWEFYADRHGGVCLEFRKDALVEAVTQSLRSQGLAPPYNQAVRYVTNVRREMRRAIDPASHPGGVTPEPMWKHIEEERHESLFFRKMLEWESEHEYRFVVTAPDMDWVYADFSDALRTVILGEQFPIDHLTDVIAASTGRGARVQQLAWSKERPHLRGFARSTERRQQ